MVTLFCLFVFFVFICAMKLLPTANLGLEPASTKTSDCNSTFDVPGAGRVLLSYLLTAQVYNFSSECVRAHVHCVCVCVCFVHQ